MKKLFLYIVFLTLCNNMVTAQQDPSSKKAKREEKNKRINAIIKQEEEGVLHYKSHFVAGFKLTTDGYGGFLEYAKAQTVNKALLFQLDISERKNSKEEKMQNLAYPSSPLIYGKINFFYPVKLGIQEQIILGNKGNKNGVAVSCNFGGGFALGLLRPYLVEVIKDDGTEFVGYDAPDNSAFLDLNRIVGGPSFGEGWKNLKLIPGIYLKSSLRFDYGKYNEMINGIEIGLSAEYYAKKIPQMISIKQNQFFLGAHLALIFGRRK